MGKYTVDDIVRGRKDLKNGAIAGYVEDRETGKEKWVIVSGATREGMAKVRAAKSKYPTGRKKIKKGAATRAFNKHYREANYATERSRAAAKRRDLCSDNKAVRTTTTYRQSPQNYDYPGVDDGSDPSCKKVTHKRRASAKQLAALRKGRRIRKANIEARKNVKGMTRRHSVGGAKKPVSLKTAVRLLRQYYENKYE